ncbi:MAG: hypothetical protein HON90_03245 [Halobacteriovoraceae bacterium]|jgi:chemotaxis protein histidine kinase CheA|nr:hypothetical protein [Halobacteriovoraceae bacterium]
MENLKADDKILSEEMLERVELLDRSIDSLLEIEKSTDLKFSKIIYDDLLAAMHSCKDGFKVVELKNEVSICHKLENFLISSFPIVGFESGIIELFVDTMTKLLNSLNGDISINLSQIDAKIQSCFSCVKNNSYKTVCEKKLPKTNHTTVNANVLKLNKQKKTTKSLKSLSYLIHIDDKIVKALEQGISDEIIVKKLDCINKIYDDTEFRSYKTSIIIDIDFSKVSPLLVSSVLQKFNPNICLVLLYSDLELIIESLSTIRDSSLDFNICLINKKNPDMQERLLKRVTTL